MEDRRRAVEQARAAEVIPMSHTYYSTVADPATTAQAYGRDMPCSPKSGRNVARAIKGMPVTRAKAFLEDVMELKAAVPFKVRVRKIHHRKGGMGPGRYPVQTVKCMLKVLESAEADGTVHIMVDDDGPGLAEEMRERVLQRGVRADEKAAGSGLGLAIVRDLAEVYQGSIALSESPLGGLRATLTLPAW